MPWGVIGSVALRVCKLVVLGAEVVAPIVRGV
jgi:hypothetical protein